MTNDSASTGTHRRGRLVVFEGPDGVGKTTLVRHTLERLVRDGAAAQSLSFPGKKQGTLGEFVYGVQHGPGVHGIDYVAPLALQALHIAAHLDAIDRWIRPAVSSGQTVLLDRFWWSTHVYGSVDGVTPEPLDLLLQAEQAHWGDVAPDLIVLVDAATPHRLEGPRDRWDKLRDVYRRLADREGTRNRVCVVRTDTLSEEAAAAQVVQHVVQLGEETP